MGVRYTPPQDLYLRPVDPQPSAARPLRFTDAQRRRSEPRYLKNGSEQTPVDVDLLRTPLPTDRTRLRQTVASSAATGDSADASSACWDLRYSTMLTVGIVTLPTAL